ncbi:MAG: Lytic transglycosylase, catalytic, partial [Polaromonas sp.]|nr:Lytic transglycosylase, catalytic [Polaromonas sp.]
MNLLAPETLKTLPLPAPTWLASRKQRVRAVALGLLVAGAAVFHATPARADVWGYVDAKGVAHFSAERLDERYELFFRGNDSFSAGAGAGIPSGRTASQGTGSGTASAPPKLLAYFD